MVKNPPAKAGDTGDMGSVPGSGRSPGGGHGIPLQYSCLGNPMDRGDWRATVHRVAESQKDILWITLHYSHKLDHFVRTRGLGQVWDLLLD